MGALQSAESPSSWPAELPEDVQRLICKSLPIKLFGLLSRCSRQLRSEAWSYCDNFPAERKWSWAPRASPCPLLIKKQIKLRVSHLSAEYVFSDPDEPRKLVILSAIEASCDILEELTLPSDECFTSAVARFGPRMGKLKRLAIVGQSRITLERFQSLLKAVAGIKSIQYLHLDIKKEHLTLKDAGAVLDALPFERYLEFSLPALELDRKLNYPNLQKIHLALPAWAEKLVYEGSLVRRSFSDDVPSRLFALTDHLPSRAHLWTTTFTHSYSWEGEHFTEWGHNTFDVVKFSCEHLTNPMHLRELLAFTGPGSEATIRYAPPISKDQESHLRILFEQPLFDAWAHRDLIPAMFEEYLEELGKFCVGRLLAQFETFGCSADVLSFAFKDTVRNSCNLLYAFLYRLRNTYNSKNLVPEPPRQRVIEWMLLPENKKRLAIDINGYSLTSGISAFQYAWSPGWAMYLRQCGGSMTARNIRGRTAVEETAGGKEVRRALLQNRGSQPLASLVSGLTGAASGYMDNIVWLLKEDTYSNDPIISLITVTHIDEIVACLNDALTYSNSIGYDHFIRIFSAIFKMHTNQAVDPVLRRPADKAKTVAAIEKLCKQVRNLTVKQIDSLVAELRAIALKDVL